MTAVVDTRVSPAASTTAAKKVGTRVQALDVLRGAAVIGMILVNNQGSGAHAFWSLSHADWNGWTAADVVFPLFVFIMGGAMAVTFALHRPPTAKIVRRAALLFAVGFGMNALPPTALADVTVMGVLQRLGLVYLLTSLVVLHVPRRRQVVLAAGVLVGYALVLALWPTRPDWSVPGLVDRALLGARHVYKNGFYDPEGLASTPAAVVSALAGYWALSYLTASGWIRSAVRNLVWWGAGLMACGLAWSLVVPINKRLWTPSYVVLMAGISVWLLAGTHRLVEGNRLPRGRHVAEVFGRNALAIFVGSELLLSVLRDRTGARVWLYQHVFVHAGFRFGSLAYALATAALWWLVAATLWRRRIVIKL